MSLVVIPARGGSRRIPRKNIKLFHGKPIIAYSIENAIAARFTDVVVSTDDDEIAEVARGYGASTIRRPADLAQDECGTQEVARHAVESLRIKRDDLVCCLYATAPLLKPNDIAYAANMQILRPCAFVVSVAAEPLRDAGGFYIGSGGNFLDRKPLYGPLTGLFVLPEQQVCDINTPADFARAEQLFAAMHEVG